MHWVVERWTQWKLLATHTLRINNALVRGAQYFVHKKLSARFGEWATEARAGGTGLLAMRCADDRLLSSLEHSFRLWRQRASTLVTVHCTSVQLLRQSAARAMRTWVAVASARARAARLAHRAVARMVSQQLAAGLSCWANRADETRHRREMMSHGLSRMASRALSTVLASWVWRIDCLAEMQRQLQGAVSQVARGRQLSALRLWRAEACALFSARALAARWMLASSKCALAVWKSVATEWMQTHERAQVAAALMLNRHLLAHWTQWKLHAAITLRTRAALVRGAQYWVQQRLSARFEAWATEARAGGTGLRAMRCADDRLLSSLEHSFRLWRQRASTLVTVHCTSVQLLRQSAARAMRTWVAVASARARAARLAHRAVARMVSQQLAAGLSCWANRADETRHRREMMSHGLSRMASRALSTGLASWVWRIDCLAEMQRQLQGAVSQVARGRQLSALRLWRAEACALFSARALAARWMLASSKCALAVWKSVATEWMQTHERAQVAAALMLNRLLLVHWTQWKLHAAIALRAHATLPVAKCDTRHEDLGGARINSPSLDSPG
ncbi:hypothetical protein AB1Y20_007023 [Prymnesium parvum]|uniref:Sfi1 spindle body domain-containing protein n=1 Tax=Prymnesium parvum TaxID=97485 RepID=A0AB34J215_PRYPA